MHVAHVACIERLIEEEEEEERKRHLQDLVLASHLALVNSHFASEAQRDPVSKKNAKPPTDSEIASYNRDLKKTQDSIMEMVTSRAEYIRGVGYADLFDLPEPEKPRVKTREEIAHEGMSAARRALASLKVSE